MPVNILPCCLVISKIPEDGEESSLRVWEKFQIPVRLAGSDTFVDFVVSLLP